MTDHTLYDTMAPSVGSLALAHQQLIRLKQSGVFINITGDVNNLALNPAPIPVQREVYGTKGRTSTDIIGYNFAPTFAVEAVRDPSTKLIVGAQAWLKDLLTAAFAEGGANKREFQFFDGLDDTLPAFEGTFSVAVAPLNTGYADKGGYTFTLANDGVVDQITSPIAGTATPIIESVSPSGLTVGDLVVIRGYKFTGTTAITIDAQNVLKFRIEDDNTIVALIPASVAGAAAIVVTNAAGASAPYAYTAA